MSLSRPTSTLLLLGLGGLVAGIAFHRTYWLEPSTPPHTPAASTIDSNPLAGETAEAEPLPLAPPIPPTDQSLHPAAVAEFQQLAGQRGIALEALDLAASRLGVADLPALVAGLSPRTPKAVRETLLDRWAELDPRAAADFLLARKTEPQWCGDGWLLHVLAAWLAQPSSDSLSQLSPAIREEVLTWIRELPAAYRQSAWIIALRQLALSDPDVAFQLVQTFGKNAKDLLHPDIFTNLARHDPIRTLQLLPRHLADHYCKQRIFQQWASQAPQSALAWAQQHPEHLTTFFAAWGQAQPRAAFEAATQLPPSRWRSYVLWTATTSWAQSDPTLVQTWLEAQPMGPRRTYLSVQLIDQLRTTDPARAARFALTLPPSPARNGAIDRTVRAWAEDSPREAADLALRAYPPGPIRDQAMRNLEPWARQDPEAALTWLQRETPDAHEALAAALLSAAAHQPEATLNWIKALPPSPVRNEHFSHYLQQLTRSQPRLAASLLTDWGEAGMKAAVDAIASTWVNREPAEAAAWAGQLSTAELRRAAWATIAGNWGERDPQAALAWMEQLPANEDRDAAADSFSRCTYQRDAALATRVSTTITDPARRLESLKHVFPFWRKEDDAAARHYLAAPGTPLSAEEKATLRALPVQP